MAKKKNDTEPEAAAETPPHPPPPAPDPADLGPAGPPTEAPAVDAAESAVDAAVAKLDAADAMLAALVADATHVVAYLEGFQAPDGTYHPVLVEGTPRSFHVSYAGERYCHSGDHADGTWIYRKER